MARRTTTRERLVSTAAELFSRQGYGQTGVNAIMREAGATSGSFYHFFATKEDLLLAVLDRESDRQKQMFAAAESAAGDPAGRLRALVAEYREALVGADFAAGSLIGAVAAELAESHPAVRSRIDELYAARARRMAGLLCEGGEALARLVVAAVEGAILQARVARNAAPFDAVADELSRHLALLAGTPEPNRPAPGRTAGSARPAATPRRRPTRADWRAW